MLGGKCKGDGAGRRAGEDAAGAPRGCILHMPGHRWHGWVGRASQSTARFLPVGGTG